MEGFRYEYHCAGAKKLAEDGLAECTEARPMVDKAADACIQAALIAEDERDEVVTLASTHTGALKLAGNLIRHIVKNKTTQTQKQAADMGQGVSGDGQTMKANVLSTESTVVGQRAGLGEKRAADEALFRGLGINPADIKPGT